MKYVIEAYGWDLNDKPLTWSIKVKQGACSVSYLPWLFTSVKSANDAIKKIKTIKNTRRI